MKNRTLYLFIVLFLISVARLNAQQNQVNELAGIKTSCRELLLSATPYATEQSYLLTDELVYAKDGDGYFKALTAEGKWDDINYASQVGNAWPPSWHLYRLMSVTRAYHKNHDARYLRGIHQALNFWMEKDFKCENWWQNQINVPYVFSSLLLMLGEDAKDSEIEFLTNILAKRVPQEKATGQNKIWQHDAEARIALLTNDGEAFKNAISQMQSVIKISTEEGIQPDYSFQQHGTMLQFGNYGLHFVNSLLFWIKVSSNSKYAFDKKLQEIIVAYCTEGLRYTIFKKGMDLTAIGRQLKINGAIRRGKVLYDSFGLINSLKIGSPSSYSLDGYSSKSPKLMPNKSFWRSAYMLQTDEGKSLISVKMQGMFYRPIETINFENLRGSLLNDGVTLIQRTGKEYRNIEPLWNWAMLPGTTTDTTTNVAAERVFKAKNTAAFIGQVSNSKAGIASMDYKRLGISANKSYFFANGMMVALGAGINAGNRKDLVTTVNQTFANHKPLTDGKNAKGQHWLWHDGIAYIFIEPSQELKTQVSLKTGRWSDVDKVSSTEIVSDSIFTAYLSHATTNSYSYLVKPNVSLEEAKKLLSSPSVKLFQNTTALQAIKIGNAHLMVFYQSGSAEFASNLKISVDQPCMMIYDQGIISISDPTRTMSKIKVTINGKTITCELPEGDLLGSTKEVKFF